MNESAEYFSMRENLRWLDNAGYKVLIVEMTLDPSKKDARHWRRVGCSSLASLER